MSNWWLIFFFFFSWNKTPINTHRSTKRRGQWSMRNVIRFFFLFRLVWRCFISELLTYYIWKARSSVRIQYFPVWPAFYIRSRCCKHRSQKSGTNSALLDAARLCSTFKSPLLFVLLITGKLGYPIPPNVFIPRYSLKNLLSSKNINSLERSQFRARFGSHGGRQNR